MLARGLTLLVALVLCGGCGGVPVGSRDGGSPERDGRATQADVAARDAADPHDAGSDLREDDGCAWVDGACVGGPGCGPLSALRLDPAVGCCEKIAGVACSVSRRYARPATYSVCKINVNGIWASG